jgi:hypothetical protein
MFGASENVSGDPEREGEPQKTDRAYIGSRDIAFGRVVGLADLRQSDCSDVPNHHLSIHRQTQIDAPNHAD